jgi:hypothetical protein
MNLIPLVWPAAFLVIAIILIWKVGDDVNPIVKGMVGGLSDHASRYATAYAFGGLLAVAASLQELAAIAVDMKWVYVAAAAKVLQPGLVAVIAFVRTPAPTTPKPNAPAAPAAPSPPPSVPAT